MFVIPDIASQLSHIEGEQSLNAEEKQQKKDEALQLYSFRSDVIHTISQLLRRKNRYQVFQKLACRLSDNETLYAIELTQVSFKFLTPYS